jgi:hypothetical protein
MRTPLRPVPAHVSRWAVRLRRLRWLDALAAWLAGWVGVLTLAPGIDRSAIGVWLAVMVSVGAAIPSLRRRWRPVTAVVGLALGWRLRPGDRAWYLATGGPRPVLVTACAWRYLVVAGVVNDLGEGVRLGRLRGVVVPLASADS